MATDIRGAARPVDLVDYGSDVEQEIARLQAAIEEMPTLTSRYPSRWLAVKLLEGDPEIVSRFDVTPARDSVLDQARRSAALLQEAHGTDIDAMVADRRYSFIHALTKDVVTGSSEDRLTLSDRIDGVVTNRVLGIPIFLAAMWFVFQMTVEVSASYVDWLDGVIGGPITRWAAAILDLLSLSGTWIESLIVEGIIAGVGGVLVFVPVLLFLYLFLALLEDSGYMARAAFVMDRLMHALGLHGKSFLPLLIGFGCNVPAIYATRVLESEEDRKLTGFLVPMMSCGARLPVYALFAAAFFPEDAGRFVFAMYVIGIFFAIVTGVVLKRTLFASKPPALFVMELPPYRLPTLKGVLIQMWERTSAFLRKATTIIMAVSIVLWALLNIPSGVENPRDSLFGQISATIAPVLAPAGFGEWEAAGSLVTGFVAKEVVVGTMSQIYVGAAEEEEAGEPTTFFEDLGEIAGGFWNATVDTVKATVSVLPGIDLMGEGEAEEEDSALVEALQAAFTPLQAVAFCVFVLLYVPCMVAVAAMRHEYGSRWMLFNAAYLTVLGWVVATIIYQGGRLLGMG